MGLGISEVGNEDTKAPQDEQNPTYGRWRNPSVSQPVLVPDVTLLKRFRTTREGLRKPSGGGGLAS